MGKEKKKVRGSDGIVAVLPKLVPIQFYSETL